jgi:hypothetical protein
LFVIEFIVSQLEESKTFSEFMNHFKMMDKKMGDKRYKKYIDGLRAQYFRTISS